MNVNFAIMNNKRAALQIAGRAKLGGSLQFEPLEPRTMMSATRVFLDFNGATQAEVNSVCSDFACWRDKPKSGGLGGFVDGFALLNEDHTWVWATEDLPDGGRTSYYRLGGYDEFSFLDFNSDGRLDRADGEIAVTRVMNRVREDFAPYNVLVLREDDTATALGRLRETATNDTLIFVKGPSEDKGGQAPLDTGNRRDDVGQAGDTVGIAHWMYDWTLAGVISRDEAADAFLNAFGNFISHEVGHTFGLEHIRLCPKTGI